MNMRTKLLTVFGSLLFSAAVYADEGRIDVTGPMTISTPGSYILVNDISASFTGISIDSSNVKLDLNGFTVSGGSVDGIAIYPKHMNIEVTNGAVTRFGRHGVFIPGGPANSRNIKISRLRVSENKIDGISMKGNIGFIIEDCLISHNGGTGIYAFSSGLVLNSVMNNNNTGLFGAAFGTGRLGYRSNAFFGNATNVSGGTNLGSNLCSGAICP